MLHCLSRHLRSGPDGDSSVAWSGEKAKRYLGVMVCCLACCLGGPRVQLGRSGILADCPARSCGNVRRAAVSVPQTAPNAHSLENVEGVLGRRRGYVSSQNTRSRTDLHRTCRSETCSRDSASRSAARAASSRRMRSARARAASRAPLRALPLSRRERCN